MHHLGILGAVGGKLAPAVAIIMTAALLLVSTRVPIHLTWGELPPAPRDNTQHLVPLIAEHRVNEGPVEEFELPQNHTAVVAQRCILQPNLPLGDQGNVLAKAGPIGGNGNVKDTSQDCWASCKADSRCAAWFWCDQREGCIDFDWQKYPYKGCELRTAEVVRRLGQPPEYDYRMSTHAVGFMQPIVPAEQVGAFTMNEVGNKLPAKAAGGLIMTTGIHPKPCQKKDGDMIHKLSVQNKIDYARLHGYEFHLFTHVVDKSLPKLYTKIGIVRKLLAETSAERAEWILWIDADTIIQEMAFQMPFHLYKRHSKNFVTWGNKDWLEAGDQRNGVNTGIMLVQNTEASKTFWRDVARVSRININTVRNHNTEEGRIKAELEDQVQISGSVDDLCDQNVIVYLLRVKAEEYMPQTLFDDRYCISCWFKDVNQYQSHTPFVNHFAACQMCTNSIPMMVEDGGEDNDWSTYCHKQFMQHFDFANRTVSMLLGCQRELVQWGPPLGQPVNGWYDCTGKRGQPMCPALPSPEQQRAGRKGKQRSGKKGKRGRKGL